MGHSSDRGTLGPSRILKYINPITCMITSTCMMYKTRGIQALEMHRNRHKSHYFYFDKKGRNGNISKAHKLVILDLPWRDGWLAV